MQFNHDSTASYEESELSTSPASYGQGNFGMHIENEVPQDQSIQVATAFHPNHHDCETDLIIASNDDVYFYAHTGFVAQVSPITLEHLLSYAIPGMKERVVPLPVSAPVLNIILHAIYKSSCELNAPTCEELIEAVDALALLGLPLKSLILPDTPLYDTLISHAPRRPLDIYALAAHHNLFDLAQYASSHLLVFPLSSITDELSTRIGPRYLRRIFLLQMSRTAALKELVMSVPIEFHSPTRACSVIEQQKQALIRAWAMGAPAFAWDKLPGKDSEFIRSYTSSCGLISFHQTLLASTFKACTGSWEVSCNVQAVERPLSGI